MKIGLIFPVCDGPLGDEKHFDRFYAELTRLNFPFAVHFDHCCKETVDFFSRHPLFVGGNWDKDPVSHFDESFRENALRALRKAGDFDYFLQMDVDETMERLAPEKVAKLVETGADVIMCRCLDLWENDRQYRVDGPFQSGTREKLFKLRGNEIEYKHPASHAPYVNRKRASKGADAKILRPSESLLYVLHWGIMNMEEAELHRKRWHEIYIRKCGNIVYGSYEYYFDPTTVVKLREFDYDTFTQEF